ncbi:hypothetical protein KY366_00315 [Candidatus Woesearchaeota archaeon]|nr:hypothetical protein [Candidatus Woesearchaeota archaeon]
MKIEIDTKHDSPEEIRKVIKMLQHLVGEQSYSNSPNIFDDSASLGIDSSSPEPSPAATNAFANMFGDASQDSKQEPVEEEKEEPEEEKERIPRVVTY